MQKVLEDDKLLLRFDSGDDLFVGLEKALADLVGGTWVVVMGIGMLEDAEIGFFDGKGYHKVVLAEPHELVALHGTVTVREGFVPHLHAGLVGPDHRMVGGHLFKAKVKVVCEMALLKLEHESVRRKDNATGLNLLTLD